MFLDKDTFNDCAKVNCKVGDVIFLVSQTFTRKHVPLRQLICVF